MQVKLRIAKTQVPHNNPTTPDDLISELNSMYQVWWSDYWPIPHTGDSYKYNDVVYSVVDVEFEKHSDTGALFITISLEDYEFVVKS